MYVDSGRLYLVGDGANTSKSLLRSGLTRDHAIVTQVGATQGGGNYSVGLRVGENNIVFHPGYSGGAFRVEGPGGFSNQNIGFTPAANVAHELRVRSDGTGNFDLTLTDGANAANVWTGSFTNPNSVGGSFGPWRNGPTTGAGYFDSLAIEIPNQLILQGETFDRNADTALIYPRFVEEIPTTSTAFVDSGVLILAPNNSGGDLYYDASGPTGAGTVSALVGVDNSGGSFNVGLRVGENNIVFHPGLAGGAFRVEGPGGFGNQNVGFTPANGQLYHLQVVSDGAGLFTATLSDPSNGTNTFTKSFTNLGSVGGNVALARRGPSNGVGIFDDFNVAGDLETFDTPTNAEALYPDWTASLSGGRAVVDDGLLLLAGSRGTDTSQTFLADGYNGPFRLTALVGAENSGGSYNVGLVVGQNNVIFHPGLAGGAFRVDGPGGFGNTNIGFMPDNGILHFMEIVSDGLGTFDITLVDGADSSNIFTSTFFNPASIDGMVGFRRSGPANGVGMFDEFVLTTPAPEPSSLVLILLGLVGVIFAARRRRAV